MILETQKPCQSYEKWWTDCWKDKRRAIKTGISSVWSPSSPTEKKWLQPDGLWTDRKFFRLCTNHKNLGCTKAKNLGCTNHNKLGCTKQKKLGCNNHKKLGCTSHKKSHLPSLAPKAEFSTRSGGAIASTTEIASGARALSSERIVLRIHSPNEAPAQ